MRSQLASASIVTPAIQRRRFAETPIGKLKPEFDGFDLADTSDDWSVRDVDMSFGVGGGLAPTLPMSVNNMSVSDGSFPSQSQSHPTQSSNSLQSSQSHASHSNCQSQSPSLPVHPSHSDNTSPQVTFPGVDLATPTRPLLESGFVPASVTTTRRKRKRVASSDALQGDKRRSAMVETPARRSVDADERSPSMILFRAGVVPAHVPDSPEPVPANQTPRETNQLNEMADIENFPAPVPVAETGRRLSNPPASTSTAKQPNDVKPQPQSRPSITTHAPKPKSGGPSGTTRRRSSVSAATASQVRPRSSVGGVGGRQPGVQVQTAKPAQSAPLVRGFTQPTTTQKHFNPKSAVQLPQKSVAKPASTSNSGKPERRTSNSVPAVPSRTDKADARPSSTAIGIPRSQSADTLAVSTSRLRPSEVPGPSSQVQQIPRPAPWAREDVEIISVPSSPEEDAASLPEEDLPVESPAPVEPVVTSATPVAVSPVAIAVVEQAPVPPVIEQAHVAPVIEQAPISPVQPAPAPTRTPAEPRRITIGGTAEGRAARAERALGANAVSNATSDPPRRSSGPVTAQVSRVSSVNSVSVPAAPSPEQKTAETLPLTANKSSPHIDAWKSIHDEMRSLSPALPAASSGPTQQATIARAEPTSAPAPHVPSDTDIIEVTNPQHVYLTAAPPRVAVPIPSPRPDTERKRKSLRVSDGSSGHGLLERGTAIGPRSSAPPAVHVPEREEQRKVAPMPRRSSGMHLSSSTTGAQTAHAAPLMTASATTTASSSSSASALSSSSRSSLGSSKHIYPSLPAPPPVPEEVYREACSQIFEGIMESVMEKMLANAPRSGDESVVVGSGAAPEVEHDSASVEYPAELAGTQEDSGTHHEYMGSQDEYLQTQNEYLGNQELGDSAGPEYTTGHEQSDSTNPQYASGQDLSYASEPTEPYPEEIWEDLPDDIRQDISTDPSAFFFSNLAALPSSTPARFMDRRFTTLSTITEATTPSSTTGFISNVSNASRTMSKVDVSASTVRGHSADWAPSIASSFNTSARTSMLSQELRPGQIARPGNPMLRDATLEDESGDRSLVSTRSPFQVSPVVARSPYGAMEAIAPVSSEAPQLHQSEVVEPAYFQPTEPEAVIEIATEEAMIETAQVPTPAAQSAVREQVGTRPQAPAQVARVAQSAATIQQTRLGVRPTVGGGKPTVTAPVRPVARPVAKPVVRPNVVPVTRPAPTSVAQPTSHPVRPVGARSIGQAPSQAPRPLGVSARPDSRLSASSQPLSRPGTSASAHPASRPGMTTNQPSAPRPLSRPGLPATRPPSEPIAKPRAVSQSTLRPAITNAQPRVVTQPSVRPTLAGQPQPQSRPNSAAIGDRGTKAPVRSVSAPSRPVSRATASRPAPPPHRPVAPVSQKPVAPVVAQRPVVRPATTTATLRPRSAQAAQATQRVVSAPARPAPATMRGPPPRASLDMPQVPIASPVQLLDEPLDEPEMFSHDTQSLHETREEVGPFLDDPAQVVVEDVEDVPDVQYEDQWQEQEALPEPVEENEPEENEPEAQAEPQSPATESSSLADSSASNSSFRSVLGFLTSILMPSPAPTAAPTQARLEPQKRPESRVQRPASTNENSRPVRRPVKPTQAFRETVRSPPKKKAVREPLAPRRALEPRNTNVDHARPRKPALPKEARGQAEDPVKLKIFVPKPKQKPVKTSDFAAAAVARLPKPGLGHRSPPKPVNIRDAERAHDFAVKAAMFERMAELQAEEAANASMSLANLSMNSSISMSQWHVDTKPGLHVPSRMGSTIIRPAGTAGSENFRPHASHAPVWAVEEAELSTSMSSSSSFLPRSSTSSNGSNLAHGQPNQANQATQPKVARKKGFDRSKATRIALTVAVRGHTPGKASRARAEERARWQAKMDLKERARQKQKEREARVREQVEREIEREERRRTVVRARAVPRMYRQGAE